MIHQADERYVSANSVKTTGQIQNNLAVGQVALAFNARTDGWGKVVIDPAGDLNFPLKEEFVIHFGLPVGQKPFWNKPKKDGATIVFSKDRICDVGVSAPKPGSREVDRLVIGWDGKNDDTAPIMYPGESKMVTIRLTGDIPSFLGYTNSDAIFEFPVTAPLCLGNRCVECDPCEPVNMRPIFYELYRQIVSARIAGGYTLGDIMNVYLLQECTSAPDPATFTATVYTISIPDNCATQNLQAVQASSDVEVVRTSNVNGISTYKAIAKYGTDPNLQPVVIRQGNLLMDCDGTCPDGYTATGEQISYLYNITYKSPEVDADAVTSGFPGGTTAVGVEYVDEAKGKGFVTVATAAPVAKNILDAYLVDGVVNVEYAGTRQGICVSTEETTYNWVETDGCQVYQQNFYLDLQVPECNGAPQTDALLAKIKAAYPTREVTLSGDVVNCIATFEMVTYTDEVCTECTVGQKGLLMTNRPNSYQGAEWYCRQEDVTFEGCKMGIKLEGKWLVNDVGECLLGQVPIYNSPLLIDASADGYVTDQYIGRMNRSLTPWSVKRLSAASVITHQGYKMQRLIDKDLVFFLGERKSDNYLERYFKDENYFLEPLTQYVDYWIRLVVPNRYADGYRHYRAIKYHFVTKYGDHQDIEQFVNAVATLGDKPKVYADSALQS